MTAIVKRIEKARTQVFTGIVALAPFAERHFARRRNRGRTYHWWREGTIAGSFLFCQVAGIRWVDEIKAHPVVARHFFVNALGDAVHQELRGRSSEGIALNFTKKVGVGWGHVVAS
jgi:hypothetical protein